jgi:hypothetical protein
MRIYWSTTFAKDGWSHGILSHKHVSIPSSGFIFRDIHLLHGFYSLIGLFWALQ